MGGVLGALAVDTLALHGGVNMEYVIGYLIAALVGLAVTYLVIRSAVRAALFDHYKTVRWYELTGEWRTGPGSYRAEPRDVALAGTDKK